MSSYTPAQLNLLLDLNLNMNLNLETTVHDDIYNVKYRQTDALYECLIFFRKIYQIIRWKTDQFSEKQIYGTEYVYNH